MKDLILHLESFITAERKDLFGRILQHRTRYISVVLEDIYQPHNASAVLRSCDCFGVQDIHIIENENQYTLNPDVALGANKWLTLTKYNKASRNTSTALNTLKQQGYRLVATTPHGPTTDLHEFDITKGKTALLFGTELNGLSDEALNHADEHLKIPMYGFTESLNISVSAAIIIQYLTHTLKQSHIDWSLNQTEKQEIKLEWLKQSVKSSEKIIEQYNAMKEKSND